MREPKAPFAKVTAVSPQITADAIEETDYEFTVELNLFDLMQAVQRHGTRYIESLIGEQIYRAVQLRYSKVIWPEMYEDTVT